MPEGAVSFSGAGITLQEMQKLLANPKEMMQEK
jgi:hypothetical protein